MATLLSALETEVRDQLQESAANIWTSAEIINHLSHGIRDLWRAVNDLHQEHFCTVDVTNVSLAASTGTLTGVPADCYRVHLIEPRDITSSGAYNRLMFSPRDLNHSDFQAARALGTADPGYGGPIFYAITAAGAPVAAPTIRVAPMVSAAVTLALTYVPTLGALTSASTNPIPGESDAALIAWTLAFARSKEREDRSPDPEWLAVYATFKQVLLTSLTPRQDQEVTEVEGCFDGEF